MNNILIAEYWPVINFFLNVACLALLSRCIWYIYCLDKRVDILLHKDIFEEHEKMKLMKNHPIFTSLSEVEVEEALSPLENNRK